MEWVEIGLAVLGAAGGAFSTFFTLFWRMKLKLEEQERNGILAQVEAEKKRAEEAQRLLSERMNSFEKRMEEQVRLLQSFIDAQHELAKDLSLTIQAQGMQKETMIELKSTVEDLREATADLVLAVERLKR